MVSVRLELPGEAGVKSPLTEIQSSNAQDEFTLTLDSNFDLNKKRTNYTSLTVYMVV